MSIASEFKEFAMRGNVIDLAVGVVIGASFGAIVKALVGGVIMPVVGVFTSGVDFTHMAARIGTTPKGVPVLLQYGLVVNTIIDFIIIAFVIFLCVRGINKLKKPVPPAAPPAPPPEQVLLAEIRDLLAKK